MPVDDLIIGWVVAGSKKQELPIAAVRADEVFDCHGVSLHDTDGCSQSVALHAPLPRC
jgi:hypothetical protein